jgi:hypothetical protein
MFCYSGEGLELTEIHALILEHQPLVSKKVMASISDDYLNDDLRVSKVYHVEINGFPRVARHNNTAPRCPPTER